MHSVDKPIVEKSKAEIEKRLAGMGDYVKMSYLQRALNSKLDFDTRKFVFMKLALIYEERRMFLEAAKMMKSAAEINTTFRDKIRDFMKVVDLFIKANDYDEAERTFLQTLALANDKEKRDLRRIYKSYVLAHAEYYLKDNKRNYAKIAFEKALSMDLDPSEKIETQKNLLDLYDKLGLIREYYNLKRGLWIIVDKI